MEIMSFEFMDSKGVILFVRGKNIDIDIKIFFYFVNFFLNNFFVRLFMMWYYMVVFIDIFDFLIFEVKLINCSVLLLVYVKFGECLMVNSYDYIVIVFDFLFCDWVNISGWLVVKCLRSLYEIMFIVDFN